MIKNQSGFSLIELMIVVAIISILTMMAMPSYKQYIQRARFSEIILATEPFKLAISLALQQNILSSDLKNGVNGIPTEPTSSKNLASLKVENGSIYAHSTEEAGNASLILLPNNDGTRWTISLDSTCLNAGLCDLI